MSYFKFKCPHCNQSIEAPEDILGQTIECPSCNGSIELPRPEPRSRPQGPAPRKRIVTPRPLQPAVQSARTPRSAPPSEKVGIRQAVGIIGAIILFVGVFAPIVSVPIMGNMNYFQNGKGDGTIVLILAVLSLVAVLAKKDAILFFTSLGCLCTLTFTFVTFKIRMNQMLAETSGGDGLFSGLASLATKAVQLQWGWALLMVGAGLTIAPIFLKSRHADNSQSESFKLGSGWRVSAGLIIGVCFLAIIGVLVGPTSGFENLAWSSVSSDKQSQKSVPPEPIGWQLKTDTSPIDDSKSYVLRRDAEESIGSGFMSSNPTLIIRHKEGELEAYITFGTYLGSDSISVTVRMGDLPAEQSEWGVSTDGKAIFCPEDNTFFVRKLLENERLVVRLTPYGENPVTCTFDLKGLSEAIQPMRHLIE